MTDGGDGRAGPGGQGRGRRGGPGQGPQNRDRNQQGQDPSGGRDRRRGEPREPTYRLSVGIALFNREGLVFLGRRRGTAELGDLPFAWQMPQGGIDPGEEPAEAAWRELYEETNVRSASLIGEAGEWLRYDLPAPVAGRAWKGRYRGQSQRWFAFRFQGDEREIDVLRPAEGRHRPEFSEWRWERLDRVSDLIVPFKRDVYLRVAELFAPLARPVGGRDEGS